MANLVQAKVTRTRLTFIPQTDEDDSDLIDPDSDSEFDVMVTNNSDQFASFQVELSAAGINPSSGLKWYRVEPRISTKKPPGQTTTFHVKIIKAPVPAYDTTIELTLKAFSIEFTKLVTQETLSLRIEKPRRSFRIYLPLEELKVMPGESVKLPILVYNLSPKHSNITLTLLEIEPENANPKIKKIQQLEDIEPIPRLDPARFSPRFGQTIEQIVPIDAGESKEVSFQFAPLAAITTFNHAHHFKVEARSDTSTYRTSKGGILEVLPWGTVEWDCPNSQQTIPSGRSRRNWFSSEPDIAIYKLSFDNQSNLFQRVQLQISEQKKDLLLTKELELEPGHQPQEINIEALERRPWLGFNRKSLFSVSPKLLDRAKQESSIRPNPNVRVFELQVKPLISPWVQLIGLLLMALLLWLAYWLYFPSSHQGVVNSVRLIGNGGVVVSASSDQTIHRWQVENNSWLPLSHLKDEGVIVPTSGVQKSVQVIRQLPDHESQIALGLENGDIQLWDVLQKQQLPQLFEEEKNEKKKNEKKKNDRIFALDFTHDSRFLFSGHGSGRIYQWDAQDGQAIADGAYPKFSISTLRVSESRANNGGNLVAMGGRYNKLAFWQWDQHRLFELPYAYQSQVSTPQFSPIMGQHDYIESLDVTEDGKFLTTSDSRGYVSLWDMQKIRSCILQQSRNDNGVTDRLRNKPNTLYSLKTCSNPLLKQWMAGQSQPVRAVAFSQNGCYLTSGGDDGRVMLWKLSDGVVQDKGENLAALSWMRFIHSARINSVDIKALNDRILVVTGDDRDRVRLFRLNRVSDHANC